MAIVTRFARTRDASFVSTTRSFIALGQFFLAHEDARANITRGGYDATRQSTFEFVAGRAHWHVTATWRGWIVKLIVVVAGDRLPNEPEARHFRRARGKPR